ncbi:MAG: hypothetical protein E3J47_03135 [Candidatus Stahlbacteria bacterium]|nr:MAG: hypothetical protein E3J47_03135 [Candidatus Stahlbacteria bacterium]
MNKCNIIFISFIFVLLFNMGYAGDVRFSGMGNLSLIFQDDFHKLDLYDFAGIPAGFLRNDSVSFVGLRASGLKEFWKEDSLTYLAIGQAVPRRLIDYAPVEAVSYYAVIPQFNLVPCELIYVSRQIEESYDYFGNASKPQAWGVYAGYSHLSRDFADVEGSDVIRTPSLAIVYSKSISDNLSYGLSGDGFCGAFTSADKEDKINLTPLGAGLGMSYNNEVVSLGMNIDYHYPMFTYTHTWEGGEFKERFTGHALSPSFGSLVKFPNITWVSALDYKWVNLGGSYDGNDIGGLKIEGLAAKTQILFAPSFIRITGFVQYDYKKPVYTDNTDNIWFETAYKNYTFGGGAGVILNIVKAGIEGLYTSIRAEDKLFEETLRSSDMSIKLGAEFGLIKDFFIRAGYNYGQFDPDLDDIIDADDCIITNTLTSGFGINFFRNTRIDLAYNYKWAKTDVDPEEQITDHIISLYLKYALISESY